MPISTSIQSSLSLGVNGGFGFALRLPAGAQWVTTDNGTKYVTLDDDGVIKRLYKFGTFNFTPVDIDTSAAIGALAGTFDVSSPGGYPVTLTTTDPNFSISGASLLVAVPLHPVAYYVKATATDPNGWKWQKLFVINVDAAPVLQDVTFSKPLFQGVALSGVVIEGVAVGATVTLNNGLTADYSVRPVTASGTPTTAGLNANAIVQTLGGVTKTNPYTFGPGIPANTSPPTIPAAPQVGVPFGTPRGAGVVLGPNDGAFTNNPTSRAVQHMRVVPGAAAGTYGTAIPTSEGGALDVRVPNANDLGFQFVRRVEAFNAAGRSGFSYSPRSATVIAAASAQPVNTTLPSLSSAMGAHSGLDDVITATPGVWTGASGGVVGGFFADNEPVEGETALTFRRTMLTLTASITYREIATGSAGTEAQASSTAIVGDPGAKTWWPALIDPVEKIDLRPGNLTFTYDDDLDYVSIAGTHITADKRTGRLSYKGGRHCWVFAPNMGTQQLQIIDNLRFAAMFSHDATGAESTDGFAFGGTPARPQDGVIYSSRGEGSSGPRNSWKWFGAENKATITRWERIASNEWRLEIAAPFPEPITAGQSIPSARKFKIAGIPGFDPLTGPHGDFECIEVLSPTSFRMKLTSFYSVAQAWLLQPRPPVGSLFNSGTVYFMAVGGAAPGGYLDAQEHPDTLGQQDKGKDCGTITWERCTGITGYQNMRVSQAVINFPTFKIIDCNLLNDTSRDPQEVTTQHFYSGKIAGLEVSGTHMQCRFGTPVDTYGMFVTEWVNQIGSANAWTTTVVNGEKRVTNPNMDGYIIDGVAPADSCTRTGSSSTMPTFLGYPGPDLSRFTDVTLEKGSGGPVAPGILDRIVVDYDGPEWIEWTITDIDPLILYKQPGSRRILAGPAYVAGTAYTFTVNLTPRGSGLTMSQSVTRGA